MRQQGETTSLVWVLWPGYFIHSWTEMTFYDVYSSHFRLRTTIFSGVNVASEGVGSSACLLSVTHGHDATGQRCGRSQ